MSVVSVSYYQLLTGDTTPASATDGIQSFIDEAETMLEDYLGRTFAYGVHTERLKLWPSRVVYPAAVPIESVPASANGEVYDEATLMNVDSDDTPYMEWPNTYEEGPLPGRRGSGYEARYWYATVTYIGGWTEDTMPPQLKKAIVRLAKALGSEFSASAVSPGVGMKRVGDVQVNIRSEDSRGVLDQYVPGMSKRLVGWKLDRK